MSVGVHSAEYLLFVVGALAPRAADRGPAATEVVRMEKQAGTGEIVVSASDRVRAAPVMSRTRRAGRPGCCARRRRSSVRSTAPLPDTIDASHAPAALSTELRAHVLAGPQPPEHRIVTVAFLRFEGTDALVAERGRRGAAEALDALVTLVQDAADAEQVCFLGSDIDADGGKLILTAGAPRALGDEDERMLLALRRIIDAGPPLPLRIGMTHGPLFAGDIGPRYRRTYTVMGDVVNLAARLMAKAPPGELYATPAVAGAIEHALRDDRARAVHRQGQGAARSRRSSVGRVVLSRGAAQGRCRCGSR